MMKVTCSWQHEKLPPPQITNLEKLTKRAAELAGLKLAGYEIALSFVPDTIMADLNARFLNHQGTTDVISFCYLEDEEALLPGDTAIELIIGIDVAMRMGTELADSSYAAELVLYLVHGLLHAAGEDDLEPQAAAEMRRQEQRVMSTLQKEFVFKEIFPVEGDS